MRPALRLAVALLALCGLPAAAGAQHDSHQQHRPAPPPLPAEEPAHQHQAPDAPPAEQDRSRGTAEQQLPPFIPRLTDADRRAAFPDVEGHAIHDRSINFLVLVDQLELTSGGGVQGVTIDATGWVGRDRSRIWFRAEGDGRGGRTEHAHAHVLFGRQVARWWDVVAGVRQDVSPGPAQTWAAFGLQGLAPLWFEIEATGYVGADGRTQARFEAEYQLLVTNRLIAQPLVEAELHGKADPERGVGAGVSRTEVGLRLRYEFRRELAPYVGVTWSRRWGGTAARARLAGDDESGATVVSGLRVWF